MIAYQRICDHCKGTYTYYESGSMTPRINDHRFCPRCMEKIERALADVKPSHEWHTFVIHYPVDEAKKMVERIERQREEDKAKEGPYNLNLVPFLGEVHVAAYTDGKIINKMFTGERVYVVKDFIGQPFVLIQNIWKRVEDGRFFVRIDSKGLYNSSCYYPVPEEIAELFRPLHEVIAHRPKKPFSGWTKEMLDLSEDFGNIKTEELLVEAVSKEMSDLIESMPSPIDKIFYQKTIYGSQDEESGGK